jgi:hypothetical protein
MKPKRDKLPITRRALSQRINRKLAKDNQRLVSNNFTAHLIDIKKASVLENAVDLEALGKKLGVLKPYETLEQGDQE